MARRRIMVIGVTGSGKTTVARRIAAKLGVPAIEFDSLFHQPNWQPTPEDEFRARVATALDAAQDGWVTDGNYRALRPVVLPRADTIVWLRPPFRVSFWRLLKRTMTRSWRKEELWNTNRESFRMAFLSRDSILLWGLTHHRAHRRNMLEYLASNPHSAEVIELHNDEEIEAFIASLADCA